MPYVYLNGLAGLGDGTLTSQGTAARYPAASIPATAAAAEVDRTNHFNSLLHMWRVNYAKSGLYSAADTRLQQKIRSWQGSLGLPQDGVASLALMKSLRDLAERWSTYHSSLRGVAEDIARTIMFVHEATPRATFYADYKAETQHALGAHPTIWECHWLPEPLYPPGSYTTFKVCYDDKAPAPETGPRSCDNDSPLGGKDHSTTDFWPARSEIGVARLGIERLRSILNHPPYWQRRSDAWKEYRKARGVPELPHGTTYVLPVAGFASSMDPYDDLQGKAEDLWQKYQEYKGTRANLPMTDCPRVRGDAEFLVKQIQRNQELSAKQKTTLVNLTGLFKMLTCGELAPRDIINHAKKLTDALLKGDRAVCNQGVGATYDPLVRLTDPALGGWGTAADGNTIRGLRAIAQAACSGQLPQPQAQTQPQQPQQSQQPWQSWQNRLPRQGLDLSQVNWRTLPGRMPSGQQPQQPQQQLPQQSGMTQAEVDDLRAQLQALQAQAQAQQQNTGAVAPALTDKLVELEERLAPTAFPPPAVLPAPTSKTPLLIGGAVLAYLLFKS